MIYTLHIWFYCRSFYTPLGRAGTTAENEYPCGHTLAGSRIVFIWLLEVFVQSFKGPSKKLKPVKPIAAKRGRQITTPHLAQKLYKDHCCLAVPINPSAAGLIAEIPRSTPETPFSAGIIAITIPTPRGIRATGACSL